MCDLRLEREGLVGENDVGEEEGRTEKKDKSKRETKTSKGWGMEFREAQQKTVHSGFQSSALLSSHMAVILACL